MTVQDEVKWLLDVIKTEWPGGSWPNELVRINRDDARILELDERGLGVDLQRYNAIGLSSGSVQRELYGTSIQYRVQTTVDVRIEGQVGDNWGETTDIDEFNTLVAYVENAINTRIKYPTVDTGDEDIGRVEYLDLRIEDEQSFSSGDKDYYRTDFTVRLRGNRQTP